MSFIDIDVAEGQTMQALWVPAETAEPKKAPAIVLVQEIFGINDAYNLRLSSGRVKAITYCALTCFGALNPA